MATQGVLISCASPGNKEDSVCSGILFADKWVLTIGTLLDTVFQDASKERKYSTKQNITPQIITVPLSVEKNLPKFTILISNNTSVAKLTTSAGFRIEGDVKSHIPQRTVNISSGSFKHCHRRVGKLAALWRCPLVTESTNQLLGEWQLTPTVSKVPEQVTSKEMLSTFLLFNLDGEGLRKVTNDGVISALGQLVDQLKRPRRGEEVVIESTIFGREFFFNSWSQGIVSKVFGNNETLLLTDARSATGCEGGPIFSQPTQNRGGARTLLGMVVSPVCWWKGEWVGFTLGVSLLPIISRLHTRSPREVLLQPSIPTGGFTEVDDGLVSSVVLVRCGAAWGSGVVVDSRLGLILTCSHVVRRWERGVSVWWEGVSLPATLVYLNKPDLAYDLALVRVTPPSHMQQVVMSYLCAVKGEPVYVAGYPMFSERDQKAIAPVVSRGIVAHVTAAMLQTTCCVQSGASGGPVLRTSGEMVAIVCCNANNLDTGALFPHVNMAIPTTAFARYVDQYRQTLDVEALRPLEEPDPSVQQIWKLQFTTSKL